MTEPLTISSDPPANPGLDFEVLKAEGIRLVQALSGEIWTDYNETDPGVTTLEQLCYALTELSYRAQIPLVDLLTDVEGRIRPRRQALFIPKRIFPVNPWTDDDYRKLIADRVPKVANVWLFPNRQRPSSRWVGGLYDIWLYVLDDGGCCCHPDNAEDVRDRVREVYARHRNLCEDVRTIRVLHPLTTTVTADVDIGDERNPESILAGIFFELGNYLAPELGREPLDALIRRGEQPSEIFDGPLLHNGFIDRCQLQPKATEIPVRDIADTISGAPGVLAVASDVEVRVGRKPYREDETICVHRSSILELDTEPQRRSGKFSLRLFRKGIQVQPDPQRVERELSKLWQSYRRTYPLAVQYPSHFAFPHGRHRDVREYYSIQNQFPNVYGINEYGLPGDATDVRKGQAKQLKGYLLAFEQLLADFFAQLARVRDLFSLKKDLQHTYFFQSLTRSVPNIEPLLEGGEAGYREGLRELVYGSDPVITRRNRFTSFLLALYAESLDAASVWDLTVDDLEDPDTSRKLLTARLELLRHLVASTHDRGRSFDYLGRPSPRNIAGMEIKSRIQLGMDPGGSGGLLDLLDEHGVDLVADPPPGHARALDRHSDLVEEEFTPLTTYRNGLNAETHGADWGPSAPLQIRTLEESLLDVGGSPDRFRLGRLPGDSEVTVVVWSPSAGGWRFAGKYPDEESAVAGCHSLRQVLEQLHHHCRQLYIVEHNLLRWGRFRDVAGEDDETRGMEMPDTRELGAAPERERDTGSEDDRHHHPPHRRFQYSFTLTAVLSVSPQLRQDESYRRFVHEVIRANAPTHLVTRYCFLRTWEVRRFEHLYWTWRKALRSGGRRQKVRASARLRHFLQHCPQRTGVDST